MIFLITGGSGSGKSAYAEEQVSKLGKGRRIYIATMMSFDEEGDKRIARHRKMRESKRFETVECYTNLSQLQLPENGIVLLECMSNLTANEMFAPDGAKEKTVESILNGIKALYGQVRHLVIVTNEVFSDGQNYDEETMRYLSYLGKINQKLAEDADEVVEVVCKIPLLIKKGQEL